MCHGLKPDHLLLMTYDLLIMTYDQLSKWKTCETIKQSHLLMSSTKMSIYIYIKIRHLFLNKLYFASKPSKTP